MRKNIWLGIGLFAFLILGLVCIGVTNPEDKPVPPRSTTPPTTAPPATTGGPTAIPRSITSPAPVVKTSAPPVKKAPPPPVTITDGVWSVGEDFPAGTYRVSTALVAGEMCYWKKSRDSEGSDIIDNGLPTGGRPQVTLKKGQWFESQGCGTWARR